MEHLDEWQGSGEVKRTKATYHLRGQLKAPGGLVDPNKRRKFFANE
jgi:hypothetical protein